MMKSRFDNREQLVGRSTAEVKCLPLVVELDQLWGGFMVPIPFEWQTKTFVRQSAKDCVGDNTIYAIEKVCLLALASASRCKNVESLPLYCK